MPFSAEPLALTEQERQELQEMTQSRTLPAGDGIRSRMILLLADGVAYQKIRDLLDTHRADHRALETPVPRASHRRFGGGVASWPAALGEDAKLQAKVLSAIQEGPKDGSTHWSCRKLRRSFTSARIPFNAFWRKPMCAHLG